MYFVQLQELASDTCIFTNSVVSVGSEIYVISRARVRVFDCCTHTWRNAPSMNVARGRAYSCVYDGKIYAEVFDPKTQTWECLPDPGTEIRKIGIHRIVEIEGKINFGSLYKMYAYDTKQGKWEHYENESGRLGKSYCVMENVSFSSGYNSIDGPIKCYWSDIKYENWKEVKGLDSLGQKHMRSGGSSSNTTKVVSFDGKLLLIWEVYMYPNPNDMKRIWFAEIMVEKRDGGEAWGNVEWVDVVLIVPTSCYLLHCLEVCV
ncbi:hypothetical protein AALP_AA7G025200 [Arabis alpina]|uniref:FKB95-like N-terminal Kelch domain-containing protein n=1 Tax=Arabis alpina TaxID=50452 RepID=A0A087GFI3_ARAAL|nr:hypothetical protein AALP_AA7G025200 [Arabis alpina]